MCWQTVYDEIYCLAIRAISLSRYRWDNSRTLLSESNEVISIHITEHILIRRATGFVGRFQDQTTRLCTTLRRGEDVDVPAAAVRSRATCIDACIDCERFGGEIVLKAIEVACWTSHEEFCYAISM